MSRQSRITTAFVEFDKTKNSIMQHLRKWTLECLVVLSIGSLISSGAAIGIIRNMQFGMNAVGSLAHTITTHRKWHE